MRTCEVRISDIIGRQQCFPEFSGTSFQTVHIKAVFSPFQVSNPRAVQLIHVSQPMDLSRFAVNI